MKVEQILKCRSGAHRNKKRRLCAARPRQRLRGLSLTQRPCDPDRAARPCQLLDHLVVTGEQRRRHVERDSQDGIYGNIDLTADRPQAALMLRARMTLPHFSVSSAMSLPKSAGESASTSPPRSTMRAFIRGSASAALTSLLSLSTISAGVAFGAPRPYQALVS